MIWLLSGEWCRNNKAQNLPPKCYMISQCFFMSSSLEPWNNLWQLVSHHGLRSDSSAFRIVLNECGLVQQTDHVAALHSAAGCVTKMTDFCIEKSCKARYWLSRKILQKYPEFLTRGISWAKLLESDSKRCSQTTFFTAEMTKKKSVAHSAQGVYPWKLSSWTNISSELLVWQRKSGPSLIWIPKSPLLVSWKILGFANKNLPTKKTMFWNL